MKEKLLQIKGVSPLAVVSTENSSLALSLTEKKAAIESANDKKTATETTNDNKAVSETTNDNKAISETTNDNKAVSETTNNKAATETTNDLKVAIQTNNVSFGNKSTIIDSTVEHSPELPVDKSVANNAQKCELTKQSKIETEFPAENSSPRMKHIGVVYQHHDRNVATPKTGGEMKARRILFSPNMPSQENVQKGRDSSPGRHLLTLADSFPEKFTVDKSSGRLFCELSKNNYRPVNRPSSHVYSIASMMSLNDLLDRGAKLDNCDDSFSVVDLDLGNNADMDSCDTTETYDKSNDNIDADNIIMVDAVFANHSVNVPHVEECEEDVFTKNERLRPHSVTDINRLVSSESITECQRIGVGNPKEHLARSKSLHTKSDDNLLRTSVRSKPRKGGLELRKLFAKIKPSFHSKSPSHVNGEKDSDKQPAKKQKFHLFRRNSKKSRSNSSALASCSSEADCLYSSNLTSSNVIVEQLLPTEVASNHDDGYHSNSTVSTVHSAEKSTSKNVKGVQVLKHVTAESGNLKLPETSLQLVASSTESLEHFVPCESRHSSSRSGTVTPESVVLKRQRSYSCAQHSRALAKVRRYTVSLADINDCEGTDYKEIVSSLHLFHHRLEIWWQHSRLAKPNIMQESASDLIRNTSCLNGSNNSAEMVSSLVLFHNILFLIVLCVKFY